MTDTPAQDWDLRFAIRVDELNKRLSHPNALPSSKPLTSHISALDIDVTATLKSAQILETMPGARRIPGPCATLTIQMELADFLVSGNGVANLCKSLAGETKTSLHYDAVTVLFQVTLQFVLAKETGTSLVFEALPENKPGIPVVTAKIENRQIIPAEQRIIDPLLESWLREHLAILSPVFALFGEGGLTLGALNYRYVQAVQAGQDLLCVYAMLSTYQGPAPEMQPLLPEFVEDGQAAFLLSTPALLGTALLPSLNAYASSIDSGTYNQVKGKVFKYDAANQMVTLDTDKLQSATISDRHNEPLFITQLDLRYGNFAGTEALQLAVIQTATLLTDHSYSNWHSGVTRTITVNWCTIHRQQIDILDVGVGAEPQGQQNLTLTARSGDSVDKTWSEPIDNSTGSPIADTLLGLFETALDGALLLFGPPGLALFLVKLAFTTAGQEINLQAIKDAQDRSTPVSPDAIVKSTKFEWGGIGDINYTSAKLAGGLKVVGS